MSLISIEIKCSVCEVVTGVLVDRDARNDPQPCPPCGGEAKRIWSVPHVSTEKTSRSIPDNVGAGRFDRIRRQRQLQKELSAAKKEYAARPTEEHAKQIKLVREEKKKAETTK